eukprot:67459_1
MYNGQTVLKSHLSPGVSATAVSLIFANCNYSDLTLNTDEHIFEIYNYGVTLDFTLDTGTFSGIQNNGGSHLYLNGDAILHISDILATKSMRFLTAYNVGFINILNSHFSEFENAIKIIQNRTNESDYSTINIKSSTFESLTDSHTIII